MCIANQALEVSWISPIPLQSAYAVHLKYNWVHLYLFAFNFGVLLSVDLILFLKYVEH